MFPACAYPTSYFPGGYFPPSPVFLAGYSDAAIMNLKAQLYDTDLYISWEVDPALYSPGQVFQLYIDGILRWSGEGTSAIVPGLHTAGNNISIHVGTVAASDRDVDHSGLLPAVPNRAALGWIGGAWIDPDLVGFYIYMSQVPGGPIDYAARVATVPAWTGPGRGLGYGRGPYGRGPYGRGIMSYRWTSRPLRPGSWSFAVASYDRAGNLSPEPRTVTIEIVGPPPGPATIGGRRIWVESYDNNTGMANIMWNPSS